MTTTVEPQSGYLGKLTEPEEQKLREFWRILMQSWNPSLPALKSGEGVKSESPTKTHRGFFSFSRPPAEPTAEETSAIPANLLATLKILNADPEELRSIQSLLLKITPERIRSSFLTILKQDHPDSLLLRFLRAAKWNLPQAWIKLVSALNWRINEYKVDEEILQKGEAHAVEISQTSKDADERKDAEGFLEQLTTGKGFFHGCDKWNRPVCIVRVGTHVVGAQSQKGLHDYIIQCVETVRLLQVSPVETMTILFDLTGLKSENWDKEAFKFIIGCFQDNYPESLGAMIFYNPPWIFNGIWKVAQGFLDPNVAAKVHSITGVEALEELIPKEHILKEIGGDEDWEYEYIRPVPNENEKLNDKATREVIMTERKGLGDELFGLTCKWIANPENENVSPRNDVIEELRRNYWDLDPYVRARTVLDRTGVIKGKGEVDFYPVARPKSVASEKETAKSDEDRTEAVPADS